MINTPEAKYIVEKLNDQLDKRLEENYGQGADWDLYAKGAYYAYKNIQMSLAQLESKNIV